MLTPWSPLPQTQNLQSSFHLQGYDFKDHTGVGGKYLSLCGWIISFIMQPFFNEKRKAQRRAAVLANPSLKRSPFHSVWLDHPFLTYLDKGELHLTGSYREPTTVENSMSYPSGSPGSGHTTTRTNWYYKGYLNSPSTQRLRREDLKVEAITSSSVEQIPSQPVCTRRPCLGRTG